MKKKSTISFFGEGENLRVKKKQLMKEIEINQMAVRKNKGFNEFL